MESELLVQAANVAEVLIVALISVGMVWARKKIKSGLLREALGLVGHAAETGFHNVKTSYVDAIKAASKDGKLTDEEKKEAMRRAKAMAKKLLSLSAAQDLLKGAGINGEVDDVLEGAIEKAVSAAKAPVVVDPSPGSTQG